MSGLTNIFLHHCPLKPDAGALLASLCDDLTDADIETIANADHGFGVAECRAVLAEVRAARAFSREQVIECYDNLTLTLHSVRDTQFSAVRLAVPSGEAGEYRRAAFAAAALLSIPALGSPYGTEPSDASMIRLLHIAIAMGPERAAQGGRLLAAVAENVGGSSFEDLPLWTGILVASLAADPSTGFRANAMARVMRLAVTRDGPGWYSYMDRNVPRIAGIGWEIEFWWVLVNHFCLRTGPRCSAESARELRRLEAMFEASVMGR